MTPSAPAAAFDDLDRHLGPDVDIEQAARHIGLYLAWCVNLGLVSDDFLQQAGNLVLRVRVREVTGTRLVTVVCGGRFAEEHLNPAGQVFTRARYADYLELVSAVFGSVYDLPDTWAAYDGIAPELTRWYMQTRPPGRSRNRWWRFWK